MRYKAEDYFQISSLFNLVLLLILDETKKGRVGFERNTGKIYFEHPEFEMLMGYTCGND